MAWVKPLPWRDEERPKPAAVTIDDQLAELWAGGATLSDIGLKLGGSRSLVAGRIARARARGDLRFALRPPTPKEERAPKPLMVKPAVVKPVLAPLPDKRSRARRRISLLWGTDREIGRELLQPSYRNRSARQRFAFVLFAFAITAARVRCSLPFLSRSSRSRCHHCRLTSFNCRRSEAEKDSRMAERSRKAESRFTMRRLSRTWSCAFAAKAHMRNQENG